MSEKQKLTSYVEVDDNTPMLKLGLMDQLRVVINKFTQDDARELEYDDGLSIEDAKLKANLGDFIYKATKPIREGRRKSVTLSISSNFDPVLEEVLSSPSVSRYYTYRIHRPQLSYDVQHFILVRLEVLIH